MSALCRYVSAQAQVSQNSIHASSNGNDVLTRENEQLRRELQVYIQKAARLQKVSKTAPNHGGNSFPLDQTLRLTISALAIIISLQKRTQLFVECVL